MTSALLSRLLMLSLSVAIAVVTTSGQTPAKKDFAEKGAGERRRRGRNGSFERGA